MASLFGPSAVSETFTGDTLIAGDYPRITDSVVVTGSAAFVRGTLLGVITASGKYTVSTTGASDGSQTPVAVLADNVDATSADVTGAPVYLAGEFNAAAMTFGSGWTATTAKAAVRDANIYIKIGAIAGDIVV